MFDGDDARDHDYDDYNNSIYDASGKVPYNKDLLGNSGAWKTQNEIFQDPNAEYTLTIDEVVNEYWNVNTNPQNKIVCVSNAQGYL